MKTITQTTFTLSLDKDSDNVDWDHFRSFLEERLPGYVINFQYSDKERTSMWAFFSRETDTNCSVEV